MDELYYWFGQLRNPQELIENASGWFSMGAYVVMAAIVFTETGLMVGFFLPGDSLMVIAGLLCVGSDGKPPILNLVLVNVVLIPAAIIGDSVGYAIGQRAGAALYRREDSRFFQKRHLLAAQAFYQHHGGKTIILARFVPIIRTFAPVVAGAAGMHYPTFLFYNVIGAVAWVTGLTAVGYALASAFPGIVRNIDILAVAVVVLSVLPMAGEVWRKLRGDSDDRVVVDTVRVAPVVESDESPRLSPSHVAGVVTGVAATADTPVAPAVSAVEPDRGA